ncbi:acyl--CoA ligase [Yoonia sp.]|nr:acyl--CoA ligase [Yoonia sp.]
MTSDAPTTIAHRFSQLAELSPERDALVFPEMTYSYGMLWALTKAFALKMSDEGVDQTSTIQLETKDLPVVLASLLASSLLGARLAEAAITDALVADNPITHRFSINHSEPSSQTACIIIDENWSPAEVLKERSLSEILGRKIDMDAAWLILSTSGTTGRPKVVGLSQHNVVRRSHAVSDEFMSGVTRASILFPYNSRPFFARALGALLNGATIVDRGDWDFWTEAGVNRVTGSVTQAKNLKIGLTGIPKIPVIEVSGAKLSDQEALRLLGGFALVDDTYGATETNKSFSNHLTLDGDGGLLRVGAPRDSVVEIVNEEGALCGASEVGEVRVSNSYCATQYLFSESSSTDVLSEGYFYPGDIASWSRTAALDILRRKEKNLINFDGVKLSSSVLEAVLVSVEGIAQAAAFESPKKGSNDLIAFVVFEPDCNRPQVTERARKACSDALGAKFAPTKIWPINNIPRKIDGHPDYEKCAELILGAVQDSKPNAAT